MTLMSISKRIISLLKNNMDISLLSFLTHARSITMFRNTVTTGPSIDTELVDKNVDRCIDPSTLE